MGEISLKGIDSGFQIKTNLWSMPFQFLICLHTFTFLLCPQCKYTVPLIYCYESDSSRPNWWGLTKFHNFRQISQFWPISQFQPNFTILEYLKYLEYLELGQFRNFCDVFNSETVAHILSRYLKAKKRKALNLRQEVDFIVTVFPIPRLYPIVKRTLDLAMLRSKTDQRWVLMIGHSKEET